MNEAEAFEQLRVEYLYHQVYIHRRERVTNDNSFRLPLHSDSSRWHKTVEAMGPACSSTFHMMIERVGMNVRRACTGPITHAIALKPDSEHAKIY